MRGAPDRLGRDFSRLYRFVHEAGGAIKVFIEREKRIGFQFAKHAPELLFHAIDGVEEIAPVDTKLVAADLPIGTQQEMKAEEAVFLFIQCSSRHQTEIGDKFLVFPAPRARALPAQRWLQ